MQKKYKIYGEEKTYDEVLAFLRKYLENVKKEEYKHRAAHILDLIEDKGAPINILDYGSGWGIFSKLISDKSNNFDVTGIDLDGMSLKISQDITGETNNLHFLNKKIFDLDKEIFELG